jgi:dipeptidase E
VQVVALGGGGFSTHGHANLIDHFVLGLAGVPHPRVCFVGTASADADSYVESFESAFAAAGATPSVIRVDDPLEVIRRTLADQHVVYVGGGDAIGLIAAWRASGIDGELIEAARRGVVMSGTSAGAMCWFDVVLDDASPRIEAGLGLVGGALVPHRREAAEHRQLVSRAVFSGLVTEAFAVDEDAALHFVDGALVNTLSAAPGNAAEHLTWSRDGSRSEELDAVQL